MQRVPLAYLEPFERDPPWTLALANRTVLVVHPFARTIERQARRRQVVFRDPRLWPEYTLKTVQAVQSAAGAPAPHASWFESLEAMQEEIASQRFDVAIIGAGAYGIPLATFVKGLGRKAVHLGGSTQLLFGILGARWERTARVRSLVTEVWCRPHPSERLHAAGAVEDGACW